MHQLVRWPCRAALFLSVTYFLTAGVFAIWSPEHNGIDLAVCYVAGATTRQGFSPYDHDVLARTRRTLDKEVAARPSLPFAYPPSVIPACALLSRLPWTAAQAIWKLLNLIFLIGAVLLGFRIFTSPALTPSDRCTAWSFTFVFSPTVSVLLVGQSSLFVLFTILLTVVLDRLEKSWAAGLTLSFALTKPHLAFPLVCLLFFRRRYRITLTAAAVFALLALLGLYMSHSDLDTYRQGLSRYADWNSAANPRLVGIQNLLTGVLGTSAFTGSVLSLTLGLLLLGVTLSLDSRVRGREAEDLLPLTLLLSVLAFAAHSYDLVFLVPVWIWAIGRARVDKRFLPILALCLVLIVPLSVVTIAYEKILSAVVPLAVFKVLIEPFRSWVLVTLFALALYLIASRIVVGDSGAGTSTTEGIGGNSSRLRS